MTRIRLLPEELVNRIAAGEVVERPAAVLKELIENSLDAGADNVEIEAGAGGRRLVSVADNGSGLSPDDLLLAVERHATSKLADETDLLHIDTLGFRGEALASIGAVSRLTITSSDNDEGAGRQMRVSAGRVMAVEDWARDRGTTVEVQDLFFNVPVRRKFLKSTSTEAAHLLDAAQRYALARPGLRLIYRHNGQELLSVSPREDPRSRLARVMGRDTARAMFPFDGRQGDARLSGFLGRPDLDRSRTSGLYLFVNGRPVSDRLLVRAVLEAYRSRLSSGRYPVAVIFLDLDPELVDVNVHPAKAEVRFRRPGDVFGAVADVLGRVLSETFRPAAAPLSSFRPAAGAGPVPAENGPAFQPPRVAEALPWADRQADGPDDGPITLPPAFAGSGRPVPAPDTAAQTPHRGLRPIGPAFLFLHPGPGAGWPVRGGPARGPRARHL